MSEGAALSPFVPRRGERRRDHRRALVVALSGRGRRRERRRAEDRRYGVGYLDRTVSPSSSP